MSILLATSILALGGLGLYMYKSRDADDDSSVEEVKETGVSFLSGLWAEEDEEKEDENEKNENEKNENEKNEKEKEKNAKDKNAYNTPHKSKTHRNRRSMSASKRRYY
ncbi:MAG: hypothetical protein ACOVRN_00240 [Flavobacterium sp.]